jgi:hypothetical protein
VPLQPAHRRRLLNLPWPPRLRPDGAEAAAAPLLLGLDCEMCATSKSSNALLSLAVVDQSGAVLLRVRAWLHTARNSPCSNFWLDHWVVKVSERVVGRH